MSRKNRCSRFDAYSPVGVTYDAATGSLAWPAPTTKGVGEILLSITKPSEKEYYKEYKVFVK